MNNENNQNPSGLILAALAVFYMIIRFAFGVAYPIALLIFLTIVASVCVIYLTKEWRMYFMLASKIQKSVNSRIVKLNSFIQKVTHKVKP